MCVCQPVEGSPNGWARTSWVVSVQLEALVTWKLVVISALNAGKMRVCYSVEWKVSLRYSQISRGNTGSLTFIGKMCEEHYPPPGKTLSSTKMSSHLGIGVWGGGFCFSLPCSTVVSEQLSQLKSETLLLLLSISDIRATWPRIARDFITTKSLGNFQRLTGAHLCRSKKGRKKSSNPNFAKSLSLRKESIV